LLEKIFESIKINQLELKNRLVVPAMVALYTNADGTASERFIAYHEHKAQGGWGLIITEDYVIAPNVGGFKVLPALYDDSQIQSHQKLTERVHAAGGRIAAQIYHAGRETSTAISGKRPEAPSPINDPTMNEIPKELTIEEIEKIEDQFAACALRVKKAGFDAVEIHGAHGYLIGEFVSPFSNKRCDKYGGTIYNRARFALEIVQKVRLAVGADFPILYRMSSVEYVPGGLGIEETKVLARLLEKAGVDAIHCSQGVYSAVAVTIPPSAVQVANYINNAAEIKKVVHIPVIAAGRINDPFLAESVIVSGKTDLVSMGRASIADPELPNKTKLGLYEDIIHCIGCVQGCSGEQKKGRGVRCLVNPMTGREDVFKLLPVEIPKKIYIAGGGVTGCEAALVLAQRGHKVTLFEKDYCLGGQWRAASVPIGKGEFSSFVAWQSIQLEKMGVPIQLNTELTEQIIEEDQPDIVMVATGSKPLVPSIDGAERANVLFANDVLLGKAKVGKRVAVIGGGLIGAETADHLAIHGSQYVAIVELLPEIMKDGEPNPKALLLRRLTEKKVDIYTSAQVLRIDDRSLIVHYQGKELILNVDTVVIAAGMKSYNPIQSGLKKYQGEVIVLGDALKVKNGYLNIQEAYEKCLVI